MAEIKGVDAAADRVDGRDIDLDVDKDGSASRSLGSLSGGFKSLAGNIRATGTVLAASAIPFGIAAIGAATPALLAVGASAAGLALNLGRAAAGFGLVAAAAGGGALVGLRVYASLLSRVVSDTRSAWEATHEHAAELLEQRRQHILGTRAANDFNAELNRQIIGLTKLEAAVGNRVFPIFTREMRAWGGVLRANQGAIVDTATSVANVAAGFSEWFRTAEDGRVFGRTLEFINSSAVKGAQALALVGRIGISALQPLIPLASRFQNTILGILRQTDKWIESAKGQRVIGSVFRDLWSDAQRLWGVLKDLGATIVNVFRALDRTGVADQATRGIESLANMLRRATREGGGLDEFLTRAKQLMPFVSGAALALAKGIGGIASAAISARQEGHKLTTLQEIFRGIGRSAKPLRQLVVGTFKDLGPEIAKLIPRLTRFFGVFAGSSGPLVTFVRTINRALQIFSGLPGPVKRTVGSLVALKLILGGLGAGSLVGGMGRFASNMFLARSAAARLGGAGALRAVAAGLGGIATTLAGGIGIVALAAAFGIAYTQSKDFRNMVNGLARDLASWGKNKFRQAKAAVLDIFDLNEQKVRRLGKTASQRFIEANTATIRAAAKKDQPAAFELGQKIGNAIGNGLSGWAKGSGEGHPRGIGKEISRIIHSSSNPVNVGRELGQGFKRGMNDVNYKSVGERITSELFAFTTSPGPFNKIKEFMSDLYKAASSRSDSLKWGFIGKQAMQTLTGGFFAAQAREKIREVIGNLYNAAKDALKAKGWGELGKDAAWGFIKGFGGVNIASAIAKKIGGVLKWIRKDNDGHSPWGSTMKLGRDAAAGFWTGWDAGFSRDRIQQMSRKLSDGMVNLGEVPQKVWDRLLRQGWKGRAGDSAERLYAPDKRYFPFGGGLGAGFVNLGDVSRRKWEALMRNGWKGIAGDNAERLYSPQQQYARSHGGRWATRPSSAGGTAITAKEMDAILAKHTRNQARLMQAGMADAPNLRAFQKSMDAGLGGYLGFRTGMGTEPQ